MPAEETLDFSLVRGDRFFRAQQALGLIPERGLGLIRRVALAVLVTWVPLVTAASAANRLWPGSGFEALLDHFGVHVRFLLAVPLFILDDALVQGIVGRIMDHFVSSGLVTNAERPRFASIVRSVARWRDGWRPWLAIAAILIAWTLSSPAVFDDHELNWAVSDPPQLPLQFAVFWYRYVARPLFMMFLLVWLWRQVLATALLWRIARLNLEIVPTHPDRSGGLGFLEVFPLAFIVPAMAIGCVLGARWMHDAVYHGMQLRAIIVPLCAFVGFTTAILLAPLLVFVRPLWAARRRALFQYGQLVAEHHRRVRRRWILGEALPHDPMLTAPELGPAAESLRLFEAVRDLWALPVSKRTLIAIPVLLALPALPLALLDLHLGDALQTVLKTLL